MASKFLASFYTPLLSGVWNCFNSVYTLILSGMCHCFIGVQSSLLHIAYAPFWCSSSFWVLLAFFNVLTESASRALTQYLLWQVSRPTYYTLRYGFTRTVRFVHHNSTVEVAHMEGLVHDTGGMTSCRIVASLQLLPHTRSDITGFGTSKTILCQRSFLALIDAVGISALGPSPYSHPTWTFCKHTSQLSKLNAAPVVLGSLTGL